MRGFSNWWEVGIVALWGAILIGAYVYLKPETPDEKSVVVCSINTPQGPVVTGDGEIPEAKLVEGRVEGKDFTYVMGPHEGCAITRITKTK